MKQYLNKDHFVFGILLGLILPGILFALLMGIEAIFISVFNLEQLMQRATMILVSIFANLFTMRYFLINKKCDKTGRGILMATFVLALVFFYFLIDF